VDPMSGQEHDDSCVRGCYRCLLTYGNQTDHEDIDRRAAIPMLLALVKSTVIPDESTIEDAPVATHAPGEQVSLDPTQLSPLAASLLSVLERFGLTPPTVADTVIDGVRVDFAYPDRRAVVICVDGDEHRDTASLLMGGWNVVQVVSDDDLGAIVAANPSVFGMLV
jgi:hypothetical protein